MLFQFYVSKSYYFHLCKCDILMGSLVFSFAGKKIPGDPREHGAQSPACISRLRAQSCLALRRSHAFPNCVLVAQSCLALRGSMDCSPPGSSVVAVLQARTLEWAAMSSSREPSWPRDRTQVSCIAGRFLSHLSPRETLQKSLRLCIMVS